MTQGQFIESLVFTAKTCLLTNNMCHYFCYILAFKLQKTGENGRNALSAEHMDGWSYCCLTSGKEEGHAGHINVDQ